MANPVNQPLFKQWSFYQTLFISTVILVYAWHVIEIDLFKLFTNAGKAGHIISGLLKPNLSIFQETLSELLKTLLMAFTATIFGTIVAVPLSFFAAQNLMSHNGGSLAVYYTVRTILNILRSVEPLIMAIIFAVWVGIGPFAGVLALMVHSIAALGKLYSEQIESIDRGPIEAVSATGANRFQTVIYAVIPQIVTPFTSFTIYRWDINVRMSIIIGAVGGGGIGQSLFQYIGLLKWKSAGMVLWLVVAAVWLMDIGSAKLRDKIN